MIERWVEAAKSAVSGDRALEDVRAIAGFHRVQASPGYDEAAAWLVNALGSAGLEAGIERAPADGRTRFHGQLMPQGWACDRATATLVGAAGREPLCDGIAEPLALILRSAPAAGRFPLVTLDDGTEDAHYEGVDVRGRVVLTSGSVHRVHALAVLERGAAGLLADGRRLLPPVRDHDTDADALNYTSFWWGPDDARGWGFVVSPRRGTELRGRLARGEALALEVEIRSRAYDTTLPLVSTRLPGRAAGEVLVVAHLCHPRPSANDNASGAAAALETARALVRILGAPGTVRDGRTVRVLWVPEITGTAAFRALDPARERGTVAALNLDMVGQDQERCGSTFLLERPPCFAGSFAEPLLARIRRASAEWVPSYSGPGHVSVARMAEVPYSGGSDHALLLDPAAGIPCPMLIQWPDRHYHSSSDTPDKSDPRSLAHAARSAAAYAAFLAEAGPPETAWLRDAVDRDARRALLAAADEPDRERALERERVRGEAALASLARLGEPPAAIAAARERLDRFADAEAAARGLARAAAAGRPGPAPRRRDRALPDALRHLVDGWTALGRAEREAFRALERALAGPEPLVDLATFACDGRRDAAAIAALVWLETGRREDARLAEWLERARRIGIVRAAEGPAAEATGDAGAR